VSERAFFKTNKTQKSMFKYKILKLIELGIKRKALIDLIKSDRATFAQKLKDNSFSDEERKKITDVFGSLM